MLFLPHLHLFIYTRARKSQIKRRRKIWPAPKKSLPLHRKIAPVAKLVDALDLGSSVSRRVGSSPIRRTTNPDCSLRVVGIFLVFMPQSQKRAPPPAALQGERGVKRFVATVHTGFCCILRARIVSSQSLLIQ